MSGNRLFPIALLALLSSCASILGSSEKQAFTLSSEPSGARVYLNGSEKGSTPFSYNYVIGDGEELVFELRQPGYTSATLNLRPKRNNGILFADAMLLHIPYLVDKNDPRLYEMPTSEINMRLYKEFGESSTRQTLPITKVSSQLTNNAALGKLQGKVLKLENNGPFRDLLQPDYLSASVSSGFRDSWIDGKVTRIGTSKGDEIIQRAKMHLQMSIRSVQVDLRGDRIRSYGPVTMELDWTVVSALVKDSVLLSIPQKVTYYANGERSSDVMNSAVVHAARVFAEEAGLPEQLAGFYGSSIALSKGSEVLVLAPTAIVFNTRREMIPALVKAVVTIQTDDGHGSGFLISNDGYLITNEHVVGKASSVKVKFEQGFTLDAQVVKVNKDFDLALVKVQATDLPALSLGDDAVLMLGEELFAIGTPLDATLGQSVSRGVLSGRRDLDGRNYLQTDVSINPGNSGGPFIDEDGKVVGVATMKISGKGLEGLGFGVPISVVLRELNINLAKP